MRSKEWMSDLMLKFVTVDLIRYPRSSSRRTIAMYFPQDHTQSRLDYRCSVASLNDLQRL